MKTRGIAARSHVMEAKKQEAVVDVLRGLTPSIEAISNLNWLILHESAHQEKVRFYAEMAEEQLSAVRSVILRHIS